LREIAQPPCRLIRGYARHVDNPPGARVTRAKTQREWTFWKDKSRPGRHVQSFSQRQEVVSRRAKAMQEQDEGTATSTLSIRTARDPRSQTAYLFFAHQ